MVFFPLFPPPLSPSFSPSPSCLVPCSIDTPASLCYLLSSGVLSPCGMHTKISTHPSILPSKSQSPHPPPIIPNPEGRERDPAHNHIMATPSSAFLASPFPYVVAITPRNVSPLRAKPPSLSNLHRRSGVFQTSTERGNETPPHIREKKSKKANKLHANTANLRLTEALIIK